MTCRKCKSNFYATGSQYFPISVISLILFVLAQAIPSTFENECAPVRALTEGRAKVRFNFTAATTAEMSIIKGETIVLTRRVDTNWYEGRIGSRCGIFPASYVHVLQEPGSSFDLASSKSPKPVGAPAAHSLVTQNGGGIYSASRHSYKPNEYSLGTDLSNVSIYFMPFNFSK